ncbi:GNAT family N-acetyltransferase [Gleimia hominis]|uniref:GNAT family N-acetyltransferase n=1 Tax=Gleimia hominis TaxID=595468 RepID=UPI001304548D|nr:GNAT family N-acetyltransferase [Gleimia hominis]WIK64990.1 GNAT family N-acetyltransferase [Gleimia hominis]
MKLVLRTATEADVPSITAACQDEAIQRYTSVPKPFTTEDAQAFVKMSQDSVSPQCHPIVENERGHLIGTLGATNYDPVQKSIEIGYWTARAHRGQGLIKQACQQLIDTLFADFDVQIIRWYAKAGNWDSWYVARALGFIFEGTQRRIENGEVVEYWCASLLKGQDTPLDAKDAPARFHLASSQQKPQEKELDPRRPLELVRQFHEVYGLPIKLGEQPTADFERVHMRMGLVGEEYAELVGAVYGPRARQEIETAQEQLRELDDQERDVIETADALADLVYVLYGMGLEAGIDLDRVLEQVQASNLSKLGADGKPIYRGDGKVLKGPGFFNPDIARALQVSSSTTEN